MAKTTGIKSTPRQPTPEPNPPEPENTRKPELATETVVIELPLGEVSEKEYLSRHVESRLRTRDQQSTMKRLLRGLQASGATTKDGRPVQRAGEAIRYMMEQIAAEGGSRDDREVNHAVR